MRQYRFATIADWNEIFVEEGGVDRTPKSKQIVQLNREEIKKGVVQLRAKVSEMIGHLV